VLKITMTVSYQDGRSVEVAVGPASQVAFERQFDLSITELGGDGTRLEHFYWLGWNASKTGVEFDAWLESVDSIDWDVDTPDPTKPAPPAT
jgi:hypothetical protein